MQFVQQLFQVVATVISVIAIAGFIALIVYHMPEHFKDTISTRNPLLFAVAGVFIYLGCSLASTIVPEEARGLCQMVGLIGALVALVAIVGFIALTIYYMLNVTKEVFGVSQPLLFAVVGVIVFFYGMWVSPRTTNELQGFFWILSVVGALGVAWYVTKVTIYIGKILDVSNKMIVGMVLLPVVFYPIVVYTQKKA